MTGQGFKPPGHIIGTATPEVGGLCICLYSEKLYREIKRRLLVNLKGTVSVISSDPPCKDCNVRLKKVPIKALCGLV